MKTLNQTELVDLLGKIKGTTFVSIESVTTPKIKAGNPFVGLRKVSKASGAIGFNYENSVNNALIKEGQDNDFKAESRKWGERIVGTPLVKHKDKFYLEVKVQSGESDYFDDKGRVENKDVKPWEYVKKSRQGLENQVIIRDYDLSNITRIKVNKNEYNIC